MYARVKTGGLVLAESTGDPDSNFLFVDVDPEGRGPEDRLFLELLDRLREFPPQHRLQLGNLVIRWPWAVDRNLGARVRDALAFMIRDIVKQARLDGLLVDLLAVDYGVARAWRIKKDNVRAFSGSRASRLVVRARSAEVRGLLQLGDAIEVPTGYHFVLPSGRHAGSFVDMSRAIRTLRDAEVLALWLLPALPANPTASVGLVLDTPALLSVASAYRSIEARLRRPAGATSVMKEYPHTAFEISRAIQMTRGDVIIPIVSVSSSGQLATAVLQAASVLSSKTVRPQVLVARHRVADDGQERPVTWTEALDESYPGEGCELCSTSDRSAKVVIEPRFLGVRSVPRPQLGVPSLWEERRNSEWWKLVDKHQAVRFDAPASSSMLDLRPKQWREPVLFDVDALFGPASLDATLDDVTAIASKRQMPRWLRGVELFAVSRREIDIVGGRATMRRVIRAVTGEQKPIVVIDPSDSAKTSRRDLASLRTAKHPAIFSLGIVTGYQVERLLAAISGTRQFSGAESPGLVAVHARSTSAMGLSRMKKPFGSKVEILFSIVVPDDAESPFAAERRLISWVLDSAQNLQRDVLGFLEERVESAGGEFWGNGSSTLIPALGSRPWFGDQISEKSIIAAAGSAMQDVREWQRRDLGGWHAVNMQAVADSYHDSAIVVAYLRWLRPSENFWGESEADIRAGFVRTLEKFADGADEQSLMISELVIAAAQGKIPVSAIPVVTEAADAFVAATTSDESLPVRAALALLDYEHGT